MEQQYHSCQLVLETQRSASLSQCEPCVFQCFEDAECLIEAEHQARRNGIVVGTVRRHLASLSRSDRMAWAAALQMVEFAREAADVVGDMSGPTRVVIGVLAAVAALPFLVIIWYAMNVVMFGLFVVEGPGWLAKGVYYLASLSLVALDVWIGYLASKLVR